MKEIKEQKKLFIPDGYIGKYGGTNYFIIPKICNLDSYVKIFKDFHDAFVDFKNQTIHIFAAFNWKELKMIEFCTVKQMTNMCDDEEGCEELRHFHYIQWFLYYLQSQDISKNNRIIFHCNKYPLKLKRGLSNYLFIPSSVSYLFKDKAKIKLDTNKFNSFWFAVHSRTIIIHQSVYVVNGTVKHTWEIIRLSYEPDNAEYKVSDINFIN